MPSRPMFLDKPSHGIALLLALGSLIGASSFFLFGCGQTGAPAAPSLALPAPVTDLAARRIGDRVQLTWTMPRRTLDKLVLKGPQRVSICRRIETAPCVVVSDSSFAPGKPASYEDMLPGALHTGPPRLLAYSVELRNRHERSAGESNTALSAAGAAPELLEELTGQVTANGVLFHWKPMSQATGEHAIDIHRTLLSDPKSAKPARGGFVGNLTPSPAREQTLVVHLDGDRDSGAALDPVAAFDQRYSYRLTRRETITLNNQSIEVESAPGPELTVDTRDTFPPAAPLDLAAVASPSDHAIDLSWSPGPEADLAGYAVYRRSGGGPLKKISSSADPLTTPAYRDDTAQPGKEYTYAVTAIDRDGNESKLSTETTESLPAQP